MYCPRCAVHNLDDAKFCRACGADIRLVPQALMGSLPAEMESGKGEGKRKTKKYKPATIDGGLKNIFKGIAFLLIFLAGLSVFRGAFWLTVWFIIPAFESIGEGIGQLIRAHRESPQLTMPPATAPALDAARPAMFAPDFTHFPSPDTAEIVPPRAPGSVTEATTRHLDTARETAAKDN
ncbi:MAG: zinc-ribbon domain-containing protein [Pyrinomonadaceae bacterium]